MNLMEDKRQNTAFEKRLRRHVIGRVREYFAVTAPGLETLCRKELENLPLSERQMRQTAGGVAFNGRITDCWMANLHLRTANRILMRIDSFKATGFGRFERSAAAIPWELYLQPGSPVAVQVATRRCRLYHSGAITERVVEAVKRRWADCAPAGGAADQNPVPQQLWVRGADDRFTISLDSSGENLYRRGIKVQGAPAPLRETLAAAILMVAGFVPGEPLIDPLCGAGTFSLEAAMASLNMPAGRFRSFAFESWPAFLHRRWDFMRRQAEQAERVPETPLIFASDRSGAVCNRLARVVTDHGLSRAVTVSRADFFDLAPARFTRAPGLVVINPPYGRRLGSPRESRDTITRICRHLTDAYGGWKYALLVPDPDVCRPLLPSFTATPIAHGGLKLTLLTGIVGADHGAPAGQPAGR